MVIKIIEFSIKFLNCNNLQWKLFEHMRNKQVESEIK